MDRSIFKAYDVRGKYPREINRSVIRTITRALVARLSPRKKTMRIIIGHDARRSSGPLYREALRTALADRRPKEIFAAGLITTPTLYMLVNTLRADGGMMITASHDPKNYNGVKMVGPRAVPISGTDAYGIVSSLGH